jgi:RNA polymerase sigma-70 factor (ECF subfamily)
VSDAATFEPHRAALTGLAYRMLGSLSDAEDVVQDAYLRWHRAAGGAVAEPRAFLVRIVTRLCLDVLKSARARRETYIGPWLPEPVLDDAALRADTASELAQDISVALLLALERLSPLERAAFLLHDVFDQDFATIGLALERSPAACRQLAARARTHVRARPPRFAADPAAAQRLVAAFMVAAYDNDIAALKNLLAADACAHTDGGGIRTAARRVIVGADRVARFMAGITRKFGTGVAAAPAVLNGMPGLLLRAADASVRTLAFEIFEGQISALYIVSNPLKLRHRSIKARILLF